jgi:adenylate cyclase
VSAAVNIQNSAERRRSKFRHDIRTSFNVLIGYSEICLEEMGSDHKEIISAMSEFIAAVHAALRDTEYALERVTLESDELFVLEISRWLKRELLPVIKMLASLRISMAVKFSADENWRNLDAALKRLAHQCLNPFSAIPFPKTQSAEQAILVSEGTDSGENRTGKVLVVDDEWDNLVVLRHKLERLKCNVTALTSPSLALKVAAENIYDVVLVDLQMPEMSGLDFITAMMADPHTCNIPVLVITAVDDSDILSECINRGAVDFLPKPVDPSILKARVLSCLERKRSADRERQMASELTLEKARVDELLSVILPAETVAELKETGTVRPRRFSNVAVLFCDVVSFTSYCETNPPEEVVAHLHSLFSEFDAIVEMNGLQKIKTIGDSFMVAGNLLRPLSDPLSAALNAGLEMIDAASVHASGWQVRVGVHVGDVVAGIVGTRQYLFDLWGDTVNTAARVEQSGRPMCVTVLKKTLPSMKMNFIMERMGKVELKGKGKFELVGVTRKPESIKA